MHLKPAAAQTLRGPQRQRVLKRRCHGDCKADRRRGKRMTDPREPIALQRRSFLNLILGVGVVGWVASLLYPVLRYLKPLSETASGPVKLTPEEVAKVEKEHFCIARSGTRKVIVFNSGGELRALDAKCTHEGCTVQYVPGDSVILCACHNGKYDVDGRVLSGPPPRPLSKWVATKEGDQVTLTKEPV
jgi:cytochrome b6-f complex iron-sulfur subunit